MAPSATSTSPALELSELEVGLGPRRLRLAEPCVLQAGRLYLIVGPSGSGKSSFARALLGFGELSDPVTPCRGVVALTDAAGHEQSLWKGALYDPAARSRMAFLPQAEKLGFVDALSVTDNLALFSHLSRSRAKAEIDRLGAQFRLTPMPRSLASASGGERIRMSAVRGLMPRQTIGVMPEVIIADEPTSALDRVSAQAMAGALIDLARSGACVVMVITHEPDLFAQGVRAKVAGDEEAVLIIECQLDDAKSEALPAENRATTTVGRLRLQNVPPVKSPAKDFAKRVMGATGQIGAFALSPVAFIWGLLEPHRPLFLLRHPLMA